MIKFLDLKAIKERLKPELSQVIQRVLDSGWLLLANSEIQRFTNKFDLLIIIDSAQAAGAYYRNKRTGSLGAAAGHNFCPVKNLDALGDGGIVTLDNKD